MRRISSVTALASAAVLTLAACGSGEEPARRPAAPAGVTVQAGSATSVHVMWKPAGAAAAISGYEVYRGASKVKAVPAGTTMTDVTGLTPSTPYTFTVRARDSRGGLSPHSDTLPVTTPAAAAEDTRPPGRPAGLRGSTEGPRGARLTWKAATTQQGVTSYDIYQGDFKIHTVGGDTAMARLTQLRPGTHYRFTVTARDAADNTSPMSASVEITTPHGPGDDPDTAPAGFRASTHADKGAQYLDLSWLPPRAGTAAPAYQIYLDGAFATTLIWGGAAPRGRATYSVYAGDKAGTGYRVKIRARLPDGNWGSFSAERTVVTGP